MTAPVKVRAMKRGGGRNNRRHQGAESAVAIKPVVPVLFDRLTDRA